MTIRVFRANTGSCGGCDAHVVLAISQSDDIELVASPLDADVWLITGILTTFTRATLIQMLGELHERPRIIAVGQCTLSGAPFGRGGAYGCRRNPGYYDPRWLPAHTHSDHGNDSECRVSRLVY